MACKVANDAHDDVGFVLAIGTIHRNQIALRLQIVLDKIARRKFGSRVFPSGCEHLDDLVRIDESALAHADDFLVVLAERFERLEFVGGPEGHEQIPAARVRDAHQHIAQLARCGLGMRPRTTTCSKPRPSVAGRQFVHDIMQFLRLESERRPHVKEYPVPIEALLGPAPRLKEPDARQRLRQHALQMRQLHDAARLIPHRRQIAHFRTSEQPLILRVVAGDGVEEVNIFHRRQPFNVEIVEPPEM